MGKVSRIYSRRDIENAFLEAFERTGGVERLVAWASEEGNYREFMQLLIKFAPKESEKEVSQAFQYISMVPPSALNRPSALRSVKRDVSDGELVD